MIRTKTWPLLNALIIFILLVITASNGLPPTAQANNQAVNNSAVALVAQAGETPGQPVTGSKVYPVKSKQIATPGKNRVKPNLPRPNLPLQPATDKKGDSTIVPADAAKPQANSVSRNVVSSFPTADLTFPGLPYSDDDLTFEGNVVPQVIPPDTMGAVGPSQFVMMINGMLRVFNKADGSRVDAFGGADPELDLFFLPVMTPVDEFSFNYTNFPRVRYDRYSSRWILLVNDVPGGLADQPNRILLAVSDGPVISQDTVWSEYYFQPQPSANPNQFADYPTLGVDANALYIGANMYNINSNTGVVTFSNSAGFVVKKSSILSGGPIAVNRFDFLTTSTANDPIAPQGVDNFDSSVTQGYFIGINGSTAQNSNNLQVRRVSNPGSDLPTISATSFTVAITPTAKPLLVPHQDPDSQPDPEKLDPIDDRLLDATIRGGRLYTAQHIGVNSAGVSNDTNSAPDRDGARWYQIRLSDFAVEKSGTVFDSTAAPNNKFYWLPSIAVSGQGHAVMGMNIAGPNTLIADAAAGKLKDDSNFSDPNVFYTSPSYYNPDLIPDTAARRWGDYSFTSVDPEDDMTFWTIQQFAYNPASYGIQIARLKAPPPAALTTASNTLQPANSNQTITINGTSSNGSGFFDPGPGFAKRLKVFIDGEVIVKSVTAVTPTSITLNVSTEFTSPGSYTVKVTNPDGQEVSLGGMVTVGNFSCTPQNVLNGNDSGADSLRAAIDAANVNGGCKVILLQPSGKITITSPLPDLPAGVSIFAQRACTDKVEIDGTGVTGNGLVMKGGYFYGIWTHGFTGRQILAQQSLINSNQKNNLRCMKVG